MASQNPVSFSRQLMENKRKSRLTGRNVNDPDYTLSSWQSGAGGRVQTNRNYDAAAALQKQNDAFAAQLAQSRQNYMGDFQMPIFQMPDYSALFASFGSQNNDQYANMLYRMQYPNAQFLEPDDPRLNLNALEPSGNQGTLAPGPAPQGPFYAGADQPATLMGAYGGPVENPAWTEYLRYLRLLQGGGQGTGNDPSGGAAPGDAPGGMSGVA